MRRHKLNKKIVEIEELNTHTNEIMRVTNIEGQNTKNAKMAAAALKKAIAAAKAAPAQAPIVNYTPLIRLQMQATRNIKLIREEMEAMKIYKRDVDKLRTTNAAATRQMIIRRIKGAKGRKHMAVHL